MTHYWPLLKQAPLLETAETILKVWIVQTMKQLTFLKLLYNKRTLEKNICDIVKSDDINWWFYSLCLHCAMTLAMFNLKKSSYLEYDPNNFLRVRQDFVA